MSYTRVLPRDLFNESKLLKCLGRVSLLLHDDCRVPPGLKIEHDGESFDIYQRLDDGGLWCLSVVVSVHGQPVTMYSTYNSKAEYPLCYEMNDGEICGTVFTASGEFTLEFFEACRLMAKAEKTTD